MAKPLTSLVVTIQTASGIERRIVDENPFTIGRSLEAAIAFSDTNVSRSHVLVKNKTGKVWIEDQGSANGTLLNGTRLVANRLTPIEPTDRVRLGNTNIEMTFEAVEKAFSEKDVSDASLAPNERDAVLNLIHGAHSEAQRLVKLGKEVHDNIVKLAEERARNLEAKMVANREQVLSQAQSQAQANIEQAKTEAQNTLQLAREQAQALIDQARNQAQTTLDQAKSGAAKVVSEAEDSAKRAVAAIHERAREIHIQAEAYRRETTQQATLEAQQLLERQQRECKSLLEAAKERILTLEAEAKAQVKETQQRAEREASVLLKEAKIEGERQATEFIEQTKTDTLLAMDKLLKEAKLKAMEEREALLRQAEDQINALRLEKRRQESEMNLQIKRLEGDLKRLQGEVADQEKLLQQKRKIAEEEVRYLQEKAEAEAQAIFDEKRQEIEVLRDERLKELEKMRAAREEETNVMIQGRLQEFDRQRRETEAKLQSLQTEYEERRRKEEGRLEALLEEHATQRRDSEEKLAAIKRQIEKLEPNLSQLHQEESQLQGNVESLRKEISELALRLDQSKKIAQDLAAEREILANSTKELEQRHGQVALAVESENRKLIDLQSDLNAQIAEAKAKHQKEIEVLRQKNQEEMDQFRLREMEQIKKDRAAVFEEIMRERDNIAHQVFNRIEKEIVRTIDASEWRKVSDPVAEQIRLALEDSTATGLTEHHADIKPLISANSRRARWNRVSWLLQGFLLGALALYGSEQAYERFQQDTNPMKTAAEQRAREIQEDLERRKFNPPQDPALRETYADCVIYTQNFVTNYLDAEFQKEWLKAATAYLLKQWRVQEENSIEVLSTINTLVSTLNELKGKIHPDYIPQGLKKMTDLETETLARIKDKLGSEVRLEALRRFEKRFYTSFFSERSPAQQGDQSPVEEAPNPGDQ